MSLQELGKGRSTNSFVGPQVWKVTHKHLSPKRSFWPYKNSSPQVSKEKRWGRKGRKTRWGWRRKRWQQQEDQNNPVGHKEREINKNKSRIQQLQWLALTWVFLGAAVVGFLCLWILLLPGFWVSWSFSVSVAPGLLPAGSCGPALPCWGTGLGEPGGTHRTPRVQQEQEPNGINLLSPH